MYKTIRNFITSMSCTLVLTSVAMLSACGDDQAVGEPLANASETLATPAELGLGDGWEELEPGLWTRIGADGGQEFAGIAEAGRQHALASLEAVEDGLKQLLALDEREETRTQLEELDGLITELSATEPPLPTEDVELRCAHTLTGTADAYPISCGVAAKATASWSHCSYTGTVRTYAQAGCGSEIKTHQCGPKSGKSVSCTSQTSITGPAPCRSYAWAQITAPSVYVYVWYENLVRGNCGPPIDPCGGPCPSGKSCHCGDVCRPTNTYCP